MKLLLAVYIFVLVLPFSQTAFVNWNEFCTMHFLRLKYYASKTFFGATERTLYHIYTTHLYADYYKYNTHTERLIEYRFLWKGWNTKKNIGFEYQIQEFSLSCSNRLFFRYKNRVFNRLFTPALFNIRNPVDFLFCHLILLPIQYRHMYNKRNNWNSIFLIPISWWIHWELLCIKRTTSGKQRVVLNVCALSSGNNLNSVLMKNIPRKSITKTILRVVDLLTKQMWRFTIQKSKKKFTIECSQQ